MESICIGVKDEIFGEKVIACIVAKDKTKMMKTKSTMPLSNK